MSRLDDLKHSASEVGLVVRSWSPGDGVTRYRFIRADAPENQHDYFGASGSNKLYTALGISEADTWLTGFSQGWFAGRESIANRRLQNV